MSGRAAVAAFVALFAGQCAAAELILSRGVATLDLKAAAEKKLGPLSGSNFKVDTFAVGFSYKPTSWLTSESTFQYFGKFYAAGHHDYRASYSAYGYAYTAIGATDALVTGDVLGLKSTLAPRFRLTRDISVYGEIGAMYARAVLVGKGSAQISGVGSYTLPDLSASYNGWVPVLGYGIRYKNVSVNYTTYTHYVQEVSIKLSIPF